MSENIFTKALTDLKDKIPKPEESDYKGEDGLTYCHKCHTAKEVKVELLEKETIMPCICECRAEELRREEEARKLYELQKKIERFRREGFPEERMQGWTFANDNGNNEKLTEAMRKYCENFLHFKREGKGLLLWGGYGTGKTYAAACVVNALIDRGYPCLMTNFARISNTLQGMFDGRQEYIDSLSRFSLLVLDDLGAERTSEYMQEIVFSIIDARYRAGLPLIITTNLAIDEIKHPREGAYLRIYDRILEMCHPIEVKGTSLRRQKAARSYEETREILGL